MPALSDQPSLNNYVSSILEEAKRGLTAAEICEELRTREYKTNAKELRGIVSQSLHRLHLCGCISKDGENKWIHIKPWEPLRKEPRKKEPQVQSVHSDDDFLETIDLLQEATCFLGANLEEIITNLRTVDVLSKRFGSIESVIRVIVNLHTMTKPQNGTLLEE